MPLPLPSKPLAAAAGHRLGSILDTGGTELAASIDEGLFLGVPPALVNTMVLTDGMMLRLTRLADAVVDLDLAHADALRKAGRIAPETASISRRTADMIGKTTALGDEIQAGRRAATQMDQLVFGGTEVPSACTTEEFLAEVSSSASWLAERIEADDEAVPCVHALVRLLLFISGLAATCEATAAGELNAIVDELGIGDL